MLHSGEDWSVVTAYHLIPFLVYRHIISSIHSAGRVSSSHIFIINLCTLFFLTLSHLVLSALLIYYPILQPYVFWASLLHGLLHNRWVGGTCSVLLKIVFSEIRSSDLAFVVCRSQKFALRLCRMSPCSGRMLPLLSLQNVGNTDCCLLKKNWVSLKIFSCFIFVTCLFYRVIQKSLRDFRPLRYSNRDGNAEGEHVNRGGETPSFCPTLQVLDMATWQMSTLAFWQIPVHRTLSYSLSTACLVTTAP
jgi:hypothetical protein